MITLEICISLRPNIFGEEKKKRKTPRGSCPGVDIRLGIQNTGKISESISEERCGDVDFCAEKCVICVVAFNYLVSV